MAKLTTTSRPATRELASRGGTSYGGLGVISNASIIPNPALTAKSSPIR